MTRFMNIVRHGSLRTYATVHDSFFENSPNSWSLQNGRVAVGQTVAEAVGRGDGHRATDAAVAAGAVGP